jgi:multidrug efflux pump subunit AcrB
MIAEKEVTSRLEAMCSGVKGVKSIKSKSENDGGVIEITMNKKIDDDAIRFELSSLIRQAWPNLPKGVSYPKLSRKSTEEEVEKPLISFVFTAPTTPYVIQKYAKEYIKPILSKITGIYKTEIYGASPMEWQIVYDAHKIEVLNITPNDIKKAIIQRFKRGNIGTTESLPILLTSGSLQQTSNRGVMTETEYFYSIPILQTNNHIIYLKDIAKIVYREAQPQYYYRVNGLNAINIVVYASAKQNNLVLCQAVKKKLAKLSSTFPNRYKLLMNYDSTEYIRMELSNIVLRIIFTLLILFIFVFVITRKLEHVLLILLLLVVNLSIASVFYYLLHVKIHLYALAGITVSLGLMTDNIIIMSDHLRTRGNRKVWLAIFAGTLATISALFIIFFLDDYIKANVVDFALIIIINQSVSLLTALFLIPALVDILKIDKKQRKTTCHTKLKYGRKVLPLKYKAKRALAFSSFYQGLYIKTYRLKIIPITVLIFSFGLPVFLLPEKLEGDNLLNKVYNKTLGSKWYNEKARTCVNIALGGSLRLFTENMTEDSFFKKPQETNLHITTSMPNGTTIQQMNALAGIMENYLGKFNEIKTFQTNISAQQINIIVYFKREFQNSSFPYQLKSQIISKATELGGADWGVFGVGVGFNNSVTEYAGSYSIKILGYNYEKTNALAEKLKNKLIQNQRVNEVYIIPELTWYKPDNYEFIVEMDSTQSLISGISAKMVYTSLKNLAIGSESFATIFTNGTAQDITLCSQQAVKTDIWELERFPLLHDSTMFKFINLCSISKVSTTPAICKENQQYLVYLQFDYIGEYVYAQKYIDETLLAFNPMLPLGYFTQSDRDYLYLGKSKNHYELLVLIIIIIYFICSILFESFLQPFAVILIIPIAYIGVFLTYFWFNISFDKGGLAAFVLLSGITVNSAIYILNDFNNLKKHHSERNLSFLKMYFRAFDYKIIPILITFISTILGFVPFLIGEKQPFWFTLAAGTIGGLVFSLVGIIIYLPLFLRIGEVRL